VYFYLSHTLTSWSTGLVIFMNHASIKLGVARCLLAICG